MRLHRFYIYEHNLNEHLCSGDQFILGDKNIQHQLLKVLRYKPGQKIVLFNGDGFEYTTVLEDILESREVKLKIIDKEQNLTIPKKEVILCQSLIKKDNFDWIVQKATEIGVSKIVPIISERSEKKTLNIERINRIAIEAAEQSGQGSLTCLSEIVSLEDFFINNSSPVVVFHREGKPFHEYMNQEDQKREPVSIFIGPEGGWSQTELDTFTKHRTEMLTLGKNILRAETAAIVASALFLLL